MYEVSKQAKAPQSFRPNASLGGAIYGLGLIWTTWYFWCQNHASVIADGRILSTIKSIPGFEFADFITLFCLQHSLLLTHSKPMTHLEVLFPRKFCQNPSKLRWTANEMILLTHGATCPFLDVDFVKRYVC